MAKKRPAKKKRQPDYQELARKVLDRVAPDAEPKAIKPAKPPAPPKRRPKNKQDAADVDRAEGEGMAQPQEKNPAAVALGRLGGLKGGKARAKALTKNQRSEIAKKAAVARWRKPSN